MADKFIDLTELSEGLKAIIQAGTKIFPCATYEDLPVEEAYEFYRILGGDHKNEIYTWDYDEEGYVLIGADDIDIVWDDVSNKPLTFTPDSHQHAVSDITDFPATMTPSDHNHVVLDVTDFPETMPPSSHTHLEVDLTVDKYSQSEINTLLLGKVSVVAGKELSANDFTDLDKSKLDSLTESAEIDYTTMSEALNTHKTSSDHDGQYYTEGEIDTALSTKVETSVFSGHTSSTTVHVVAGEKDTWNGKSDAHTHPYRADDWLPPNDHTHSNKVLLDDITSEVKVLATLPETPVANQIVLLEV